MDDDIHVINVYKAHLRFNRQDDRIQYILQNEQSSDADIPTAGGGAATVGDRRKRVSVDDAKARKSTKQDAYADWISESPLPDCRVCWAWVLNKQPCNGPFCKRAPKRDHHYAPGTTKAEKTAFVTWLEEKP